MKFKIEGDLTVPIVDLLDIPITPKSMNSYDFYDIFEEAAKYFYWGLGGWKEVWPLYFHAIRDDGKLLSSADIYILSADIKFDILIK
jgi:hypothetical protein